MTADTRVTGHARHATGGAGGPVPHHSHPRLVLAVLAAVVLLDQATKWWAWRHLPGAVINPGGDQLVGPKVGTWYSEQLSGAVLDLQGAVVLALTVSLLVRIRRRVFGVPAAMAVAGWSSNALDRLGLHFWTAPGSVRGAVDFIPFHHCIYNVADFFIIGGTGFLLAVVACALVARRPHVRLRPGPVLRRPRHGPLARLGIAAAATGLLTAVAVGAAHDTGLTSPEAEGSPPGVTSAP
jgi:lipoprotein signal peptidase